MWTVQITEDMQDVCIYLSLEFKHSFFQEIILLDSMDVESIFCLNLFPTQNKHYFILTFLVLHWYWYQYCIVLQCQWSSFALVLYCLLEEFECLEGHIFPIWPLHDLVAPGRSEQSLVMLVCIRCYEGGRNVHLIIIACKKARIVH